MAKWLRCEATHHVEATEYTHAKAYGFSYGALIVRKSCKGHRLSGCAWVSVRNALRRRMENQFGPVTGELCAKVLDDRLAVDFLCATPPEKHCYAFSIAFGTHGISLEREVLLKRHGEEGDISGGMFRELDSVIRQAHAIRIVGTVDCTK